MEKMITARRIAGYGMLSTLMISLLAAAGCSGEQQTATQAPNAAPNASSGQTILNVYSWTVEESMKPFIDAFEKKYPNIKVKYTKMADANTSTANSLLASGEPIDVIPQAFVDDMRLRASNGLYEPLDEYMKADNIDFTKTFGSAINDLELVNGKHYALPYSMVTYGLYYNKDLFDKAGVAYPTDDWTWDDLRAAAKKLTSGSGANKVYGFLPDYSVQWNFPAILQVGNEYVYKNNGKESNWDHPAFLKSLQYFYDMEMVDKSAWPLSEYKALKLDSNPHFAFLQGKTAMYIQPTYVVKYSSQASYGFTNFNFGVANLPKVNSGDNLKNIFYISDYSIPVNAPNKKAAWDYLKFYCMEAPEIFAQSKGMTPANVGSLDSDKKDTVGKKIFDFPHFDQPTGVKTFITNKMDLTSLYTVNSTAKNEISDLVKNEVTNALLGNQTPAQAIANIKKQSDELIAKAKK